MMDRRLLVTGVVLAGGVLMAPAEAQDGGASRAVAERFAATLSAHDIAAFADLFADGYVNHQVSAAAPPPPADKSPKQATIGFFAARLAGIPDLQVVVEAVVAAPDQFAASFVYSGTHGGPLYGVAATGKHLRFTSCDIFRLQAGKIAEHWGMGDIAGVLAQLRS